MSPDVYQSATSLTTSWLFGKMSHKLLHRHMSSEPIPVFKPYGNNLVAGTLSAPSHEPHTHIRDLNHLNSKYRSWQP